MVLVLLKVNEIHKNIIQTGVEKNSISCYHYYLFDIWKNNMNWQEEDLVQGVYEYNFLGSHSLLTSILMQAFV